MTPSLHHLVEDHLKPKWWQFFRKQKFHICRNYGSMVVYEVPKKCVMSGKLHEARQCARIRLGEVIPNCDDGCKPILASDPAFFQKLDEYLARGCYAEERESQSLKADKFVSATMVGPQGPPGPMGPAGPAGGGLVI